MKRFGNMATVFDVAQYILECTGQITTIKLEKIVYYAQAWHLVWEEEPLFNERIEAWATGPVVPNLYSKHQGQFKVDASCGFGNSLNLLPHEKETIDAIISFYGKNNSEYLVLLTHSEDLWKDARKRAKVLAGERCNEEITLADMAEYYSGLLDE